MQRETCSSWKWGELALMAAALLSINTVGLTGEEDRPPLFKVIDAKPLPEWDAMFVREHGWTGGDGAYSVALSPGRMLWLFADTWIGQVEGGRRKDATLINNTFAWQSRSRPLEELQFFWATSAAKPAAPRDVPAAPRAVLKPKEEEAWHWPGPGALIDGRLYLFCKKVRKQAEGEEGFQFDWYADDLLCIDNPQAEPTEWKVSATVEVNRGKESPHWGTACVVHDSHLYIYGLCPDKDRKPLTRPVALARAPATHAGIMDTSAWEYWFGEDARPEWRAAYKNQTRLFKDGAAEMSVQQVAGLDGWFAVYTSLGLGRKIMIRSAPSPEGPWSWSVLAYECPEGDEMFMYGAKGHPELSTKPGEIIVSYCRNAKSLAAHFEHPDIYVPKFVRVVLKNDGQ